jgi:rare lipoprotein A
LLKAVLSLLGVFVAISQAQAGWVGRASYYRNPKFSGLVAAHRSLPFGTRLLVTNLGNGRAVTVVVVDRGPFIRSRIIDVSTRAADALGFRGAGLARVKLDLVDK